MHERIAEILVEISGYVWGLPLIFLLLGTGIYLTILLRGLQIWALVPALKLAFLKKYQEHDAQGDISHFQALMTALSATIGVGNIAGVATAIAIGGPGALFWMWVTGFLGMASKYSESVLAVKYREVDKFGTMSGGPMYYLSKGLGFKRLGAVFAVFTMLATFGIGNMVQSNSVAHALEGAFHVPVWITGLVLCIGTGIVILGGIKSIAKATGMIVPFMLIFFILGSIISLIEFRDNILNAFYQVFYYAFSAPAAAGGFLGTTIAQTMRIGVARGIFSNEAGLGSSPIAAAAAKTANPVSQALVSMTQTFIDTIIGCTFTGIVIIASGVWTSGETGSRLASLAYESGTSPVIGSTIVSVSLAFFAYATLVGWSYFGEKAVEYLFKEGVVKPYRIAFTLAVFVGAVVKLEIVWAFADIMNGLMAFPNLVGLLGLSKVVVEETKKYLPGELARLKG